MINILKAITDGHGCYRENRRGNWNAEGGKQGGWAGLLEDGKMWSILMDLGPSRAVEGSGRGKGPCVHRRHPSSPQSWYPTALQVPGLSMSMGCGVPSP